VIVKAALKSLSLPAGDFGISFNRRKID